MKSCGLFIVCACITINAHAQSIRSLLFNPPGADDGLEYVEIEHFPNASLSGIWLLEIDGDGANGNVNSAINLSPHSVGSNGLLLMRDNAAVINPAPSMLTNVVVHNFAPDIQNGTSTFLLVLDFSGSVGMDLDPDNDGALNLTPWTQVLSAVSTTDGGATDDQYADDVGGINLPDISAFEAEGLSKMNGIYFAIDVSGSGTGPFAIDAAWDANASRNSALEQLTLTPGNTNNPLPVKFVGFNVSDQSGTLLIRWSTSLESGISHFIIEASTDGLNFDSIGSKNANNTFSVNNYSFESASLRNYDLFRVKAIEYSGAIIYSNVARLSLVQGPKRLKFYPNPLTGTQFTISGLTAEKGVLVRVFEISGREVISEYKDVFNGMVLLNLKFRPPPGIYYIYVTATNTRQWHGSVLVKN